MGNSITEKMKIGAVGELLVQLRLLEFGVQAAPPLKGTGNDLIAVRVEVFRGIQIKTTAHDKTCNRPLPEHYHLLAVVRLEANDAQLFLDRSDIHLIPRSVIERNGKLPKDLSEYLISQNHINALFPPLDKSNHTNPPDRDALARDERSTEPFEASISKRKRERSCEQTSATKLTMTSPITDEQLWKWYDRMKVNRGYNDDWPQVINELLWELYVRADPSREQQFLFQTVTALQAALENSFDSWRSGYYLHLEEAFGLKRPKGWHRAAVLKKAKHADEAVNLVRKALFEGAKTPGVFQDVFESGKLPENISASQIQKWYYEAKRKYPILFPSVSQKKKRNLEKKT